MTVSIAQVRSRQEFNTIVTKVGVKKLNWVQTSCAKASSGKLKKVQDAKTELMNLVGKLVNDQVIDVNDFSYISQTYYNLVIPGVIGWSTPEEVWESAIQLLGIKVDATK